MARPLAAAGFDVRETATGRDALRLARQGVDAIVLDLVLVDMEGWEVLRRLKTDALTRNVPVILKTAVQVEEGDRQRGLESGAHAYFAEPFDPQALIAAVRGVLGDGSSDPSSKK
jgi:DNA-binding response OmpR family regulator